VAAVLSVSLACDRSELVRLADLVDRFGAEQALSPDDLTNVHLVLDELVSNVIRHGHIANNGTVDVSLAVDSGTLTIDIVDDGIAFDPLACPSPNLDLPIEERPIGGLGIHIVKALSETIAYRRDGGRNHLSLTMRLAVRG
jgi:anti-sigma regulatory factor (Ser/Thr protein kinase)